MNIEYRIEKLVSFSKRSIIYIHLEWGVPEPFNIVAFAFIALISIIMARLILMRLMGSSKLKNQEKFKFNHPDYSEIGVLVNNVRKLHEEVTEIKKALVSVGTNNNVRRHYVFNDVPFRVLVLMWRILKLNKSSLKSRAS